MPAKIFKLRLSIRKLLNQTLIIKCLKILKFGIQDGELNVWFLYDPERECVYRFRLFSTGVEVPDDLIHEETIITPCSEVYHVFRIPNS